MISPTPVHFPFTSRAKAKFNLCVASFVEVDSERYQRQPPLLGQAHQSVNLASDASATYGADEGRSFAAKLGHKERCACCRAKVRPC
jgi:hypothetical protein